MRCKRGILKEETGKKRKIENAEEDVIACGQVRILFVFYFLHLFYVNI